MSVTIVNGEAIDAAGARPGETEQADSPAYAPAGGCVDDPPVRTAARFGDICEVAAAHPPTITAPDRMISVPVTGPTVTPHVAQEAELRHGYTLSHLDQLAVQAIRAQRFNRQIDFTDRVDIGWSAMAESLYAAAEPPAPQDLVRAMWAAISDDTDRNHRTHGWSTHDRYAGVTARFQQYWVGAGHRTRSPEEPVVERAVLSQIWPRLSPTHRQLLLMMAVHADYERAAEALEKSRKSFSTKLAQARRAFLALWHDGERPSRLWGPTGARAADSTDRHSRTYVIRVANDVGRHT